MNWAEFLGPYQAGDTPLLSEAFVTRWGGERWEPQDGDRKAAGKLHMEVASRISTQRLGYLDGVEKSALDSVYALFQRTRDIGDEFPESRHFDALAWDVLNTRVRPFTAKWHCESQRGALTALDATDEFRAELATLQPLLQRFDDLLLHLRDDRPPPRAADHPSERDSGIAGEMAAEVRWGIPRYCSGLEGVCPTVVQSINAAEASAICARRGSLRHSAGQAPCRRAGPVRRRDPVSHVLTRRARRARETGCASPVRLPFDRLRRGLSRILPQRVSSLSQWRGHWPSRRRAAIPPRGRRGGRPAAPSPSQQVSGDRLVVAAVERDVRSGLWNVAERSRHRVHRGGCGRDRTGTPLGSAAPGTIEAGDPRCARCSRPRRAGFTVGRPGPGRFPAACRYLRRRSGGGAAHVALLARTRWSARVVSRSVDERLDLVAGGREALARARRRDPADHFRRCRSLRHGVEARRRAPDRSRRHRRACVLSRTVLGHL